MCPFSGLLICLSLSPTSQVANAPRRPTRDPATAAPIASAAAITRPSAAAPPSERKGEGKRLGSFPAPLNYA